MLPVRGPVTRATAGGAGGALGGLTGGHLRGGEHGVTGNELVELVVILDATAPTSGAGVSLA
jgi:hypothetical protein